MRSRSLVILALVVVALGAFIYLSERHMPTTEERQRKADRVFPDFDRDDVTGLTVANSHGSFRIVREGESWRLVEPIAFPADSTAVSSLLGSLERLDAERTLTADEVDPSAYGFDDPPMAVTVDLSGGDSLKLAIGDEAALGSNRAMRRGDDPEVILAPEWIVSDLDKDLDGWRSREVVDVSADDVASLQILADGDRIQVVREGDTWRLLEPLEDLADADHVRNLVSDLGALRVEEFLDQPPAAAELGLDTPAYQVTIVRTDGAAPVRLDFGASRTEGGRTQIACRRNGSELFWVDDRAATRLAKAPVRWRATKVAAFDSWDAEELTLQSGEDAVTLVRSDGLWSDPAGGEVDYTAVQSRLTSLAGLEAVEFDLVEPASPATGTVELTLSSGDEEEPRRLVMTFYPPLTDGGQALVRTSERPTVMSVDAAAVERILADPGALIRPAEETAEADGTGEPTDEG